MRVPFLMNSYAERIKFYSTMPLEEVTSRSVPIMNLRFLTIVQFTQWRRTTRHETIFIRWIHEMHTIYRSKRTQIQYQSQTFYQNQLCHVAWCLSVYYYPYYLIVLNNPIFSYSHFDRIFVKYMQCTTFIIWHNGNCYPTDSFYTWRTPLIILWTK